MSRILEGLTGGNITIAQSYIADTTTDEERAKGLGLIGAAFGHEILWKQKHSLVALSATA